MSGLSLSLLCGFKMIFEDEKQLKIQEYLQGIEKHLLLKLATSLLAYDPSTSTYNDWRELLQMWFGTKQDDEIKQKAWSRCENLEREHKQISLLSIIASLKLFEFVFSLEETDLNKDIAMQDEKIANGNLFKAYLLFVDEVTSNENNNRERNKEYLNQKEEDLKAPLTILNQNYPYCDLQNFDLTEIFLCQLVKAFYLFNFLADNEKGAELLKQLYQIFGISKAKEYFEHVTLIFNAYKNSNTEGWIEFEVIKNEVYEKNCKFLEAISLQNFDKELNADFKLLRGNPLHKVAEGRYSIISSLFATEKIFKGLYFKLKELNDNTTVELRIKNFRSFYTTNFSENYLLYKVMEYIYGNRNYIQYPGEFLASIGITGAPDYYIRKGNYLFLFENKDIFINADVKQSGNLEMIEKEFQKKLYYDKKDTKIDPKAVIQLVNNVRKALTNENGFDNKYKPKNLNIYPILILHDSSFNAVGLNYLVNYWFQIELDKLKSDNISIAKVRPITIINIDTLILYADYLKLKKDTLEDLLDAYKKKNTFIYKRNFKDFEHFKAVYGNTLLPFTYFIEQYTGRGFTKISQKFKDLVFTGIINES